MNHSDEELQSRFDRGEPTEDSADARAYAHVYDALRQETFTPNAQFADRVIQRIESRAENPVRDYFWIGVGIVVFVIAAVVSVFLTGITPDSGALKFVSTYAGWGILCLVALLIIQVVDRHLIRNKLAL